MFRFHLRYKRVAVIAFLLVCLFLFWLLWPAKREGHLNCNVPDSVKTKMKELTEKIHEALNALRLTHFLCYNSLWGALKLKSSLPWSNVVELCVLNEEVSQVDEGFLIRSFKRLGVDISYSSADGVYHVGFKGDDSCSARIVVFEEDTITHQMRRVGWKNRLLPPNSCETLHCFPPNLLIKPLPKTSFMGVKLSIPREDFEIQKYLFPDSWWKELEPEACKTSKTLL